MFEEKNPVIWLLCRKQDKNKNEEEVYYGNKFPNGVYPVMLTPFTEQNQVDYAALGKLVDWYIEKGVAGLFADCQSSRCFSFS